MMMSKIPPLDITPEQAERFAQLIPEMLDDIRQLAGDLLGDSSAAHKRRVANRHGVRESSELVAACDHHNWDLFHRWCDTCGVTWFELINGG